MSHTAATFTVRRCNAQLVAPYLAQLDRWLLPTSQFGVLETWPLLYDARGTGRFYLVCEGEQVLGHCATFVTTAKCGDTCHPIAMLGSVATAPQRRGEGIASTALHAALQDLDAQVACTLLWAEQPNLYARCGFRPGPRETLLTMARRPHPDTTGCRFAQPTDYAALHALHACKPQRIERNLDTMTRLLATPGMRTLVRERQGRITAYACCGKGADLQGAWHEFGGSDAEVAALLQAAMHALGQTHASVLLPGYRVDLTRCLGATVVATHEIAGPMQRSSATTSLRLFVDGLDSI